MQKLSCIKKMQHFLEQRLSMLACCANCERHVVYDDLLLAGVLRPQPIGLGRVEADGRELLERRRENEHLRSADTMSAWLPCCRLAKSLRLTLMLGIPCDSPSSLGATAL